MTDHEDTSAGHPSRRPEDDAAFVSSSPSQLIEILIAHASEMLFWAFLETNF